MLLQKVKTLPLPPSLATRKLGLSIKLHLGSNWVADCEPLDIEQAIEHKSKHLKSQSYYLNVHHMGYHRSWNNDGSL